MFKLPYFGHMASLNPQLFLPKLFQKNSLIIVNSSINPLLIKWKQRFCQLLTFNRALFINFIQLIKYQI